MSSEITRETQLASPLWSTRIACGEWRNAIHGSINYSGNGNSSQGLFIFRVAHQTGKLCDKEYHGSYIVVLRLDGGTC